MFNGISGLFNTKNKKQEEEKANFLSLETELKSKVEEIKELMDKIDSTIEEKANGIVELYKLKDNFYRKWLKRDINNQKLVYYDKDIDNDIDALKMKLFHIYAESVNGKVVNIVDEKKFYRDCVYYKFGPGYTLMELGHYIRSIDDDEAERIGNISTCYVFVNNNVSCQTIHFIKVNDPKVNDPSNAGGKPRRTRRHKNKKRRSSKQQKSKK